MYHMSSCWLGSDAVTCPGGDICHHVLAFILSFFAASSFICLQIVGYSTWCASVCPPFLCDGCLIICFSCRWCAVSRSQTPPLLQMVCCRYISDPASPGVLSVHLRPRLSRCAVGTAQTSPLPVCCRYISDPVSPADGVLSVHLRPRLSRRWCAVVTRRWRR